MNPCSPRACRETTHECYGCGSNAECDDGWFCTGVETCVATECRAGTPRCIPDQFCSETLQACVACLIDADCADGNACTKDLCSNNACIRGQTVDCSTTDPCLLSSCDPASGCVYAQVCDDGDPCTWDTCNGQTGACTHQDIGQRVDTCTQNGWTHSATPPLRLLVNNDDDNGNGVADYLDLGPVAGENDLVRVPISIGWGPVLPICSCPDTSEYHVDVGGSAFGLFLNPDQTGDALSFGPGAAAVYASGRSPSSACGAPLSLTTVCCSTMHTCTVTTGPIVVLAVGSLTWEKADPSNADLEANAPINGGVRIFPDKLSPTDSTPTIRRQVKLVATVAPPVAGVTVYFKVFDVDDPFDQLNPSMPDVGLIDSTPTSGPDNRPSGDVPWTPPSAPTTDSQGKARVTFTVSMQPGNNYRAAGSLIQAALTQSTTYGGQTVNPQQHADALNVLGGSWSGYSAPLIWSPMLTVWRKLHVETDTMVRPTFVQNTFVMPWNEPRTGPVPTQVVFDVNDPPSGGGQTNTQQFTQGYVDLKDAAGNSVTVARTVDYVSNEGPLTYDDAVTINLPDCGGGQSGLACLGGVISGSTTLSDDDLSEPAAFQAKVWGCDNTYAGGGSVLLAPDLSILAERYRPGYIEPVPEASVSGTGAITTFLRNQDFGAGGNYGKALWDQAKAPTVRQLPVSTLDFWTVMVVSAWQAEETQDGDPDTEDQVGIGITRGINTHADGSRTGLSGPNYTGICAVFRGVFGEVGFAGLEKYTVAHEIGHTFGLPHNNIGRGDPPIDMMDSMGPGQLLPLKASNLRKLREYTGP